MVGIGQRSVSCRRQPWCALEASHAGDCARAVKGSNRMRDEVADRIRKREEQRRRMLGGPSLTVRLPDDVHGALVARAKDLGCSVNALVVAALEAALEEQT